MKFIGFLDTFFILSLGITFVLLLVLVYHFRKRLNENESKYEKLLTIVNDIVQKLNEQQTINSAPNLYSNSDIMNPNNWDMETINRLNLTDQSNIIAEELEEDDEIEVATFTGEEGSDEDEETDDEEAGSDEEGSDEEEEGSDEEEEGSDEEEEGSDEEEKVKTINITDDKVDSTIDTEELEDDDPIDEKEVNLDVEPLTEIDPIKVDKTDIIDYSSMTVTDLRKIVKDKELATNVSKLKKSDLLNLLAC